MERDVSANRDVLTIEWHGYPDQLTSSVIAVAIVAFSLRFVGELGLFVLFLLLILALVFISNLLRTRSLTVLLQNQIIILSTSFAGLVVSKSSHSLRNARAIEIHELIFGGFSVYQTILLDINYKPISIFGMFARRSKALATAKKLQAFVGPKPIQTQNEPGPFVP